MIRCDQWLENTCKGHRFGLHPFFDQGLGCLPCLISGAAEGDATVRGGKRCELLDDDWPALPLADSVFLELADSPGNCLPPDVRTVKTPDSWGQFGTEAPGLNAMWPCRADPPGARYLFFRPNTHWYGVLCAAP
jgi:hypothetical protein